MNPSFALIGVGENNNFGHPSDITLTNLEAMGCRIYRTDKMGEISIQVNGKKIKINNKCN